jgi:DMSO/TMAO reductase YedYZ molybdopterin-dependent catalytic subunit
MAIFFKTLVTANKRLTIDQLIAKKTVISFFFFFLLMGAGFASWKWLRSQPTTADGTNAPLRKVLNINEQIFKGLVDQHHLAKEYPASEAVPGARVNGYYGIQSALDSNWHLNVIKKNGDTLKISLDQIKRLPKIDIVFNFKCIEGWSEITHWSGVKFSDFVTAFGLNEESEMNYVGLDTPDKAYYVGIDMASALHPQTILCYELNNKPLPLNQGFPLRLIIPVKYGVKHIKRIGTIFFDNDRPRDYWAERGYDYFTGL